MEDSSHGDALQQQRNHGGDDTSDGQEHSASLVSASSTTNKTTTIHWGLQTFKSLCRESCILVMEAIGQQVRNIIYLPRMLPQLPPYVLRLTKRQLLWLLVPPEESFITFILKSLITMTVGFIIQVSIFSFKEYCMYDRERPDHHSWLERNNEQRRIWQWLAPLLSLPVSRCIIALCWLWEKGKEHANTKISIAGTQDQGLADTVSKSSDPPPTSIATIGDQSPAATASTTCEEEDHSPFELASDFDADESFTAPRKNAVLQRLVTDARKTVLNGLRDELQSEMDERYARAKTQSKRWLQQILDRPVSLLARVRDTTEEEKESPEASLMLAFEDQSRTVEVTDDASNLSGTKRSFSGFNHLLPREATNVDLWRCLIPAFLTFQRGHPTCVFFDGYSGSGKTYALFRGPDAIAFTAAKEVYGWVAGQMEIQLRIATARHTAKKGSNGLIEQTSHRDTLDGALQAIEHAYQQRDKENRSTANNKNSSRSHLMVEFLVKGQLGGEIVNLCLCLVDLAGTEPQALPDPKVEKGSGISVKKAEKDQKDREQQAEERDFIHDSRDRVHLCLTNPGELTMINNTPFTKHLRRYFFIEPERNKTKSDTAQPVPKIFHVSLLSPLLRNKAATMTTLQFAESVGPSKRKGTI